MPKRSITFKGDLFDITLEGDSNKEIVAEFLASKKEIEKTLRSGGVELASHATSSHASKRIAPSHHSEPLDALSLQDLSIPTPIKDAFVERKDSLSNWDSLFLLLHFHSAGLTNKRLRSLSEEFGKEIKFSWFDGEFHRRNNEGLVMSKRVPGKKEALYFLTEPGKKQAEALIQKLQNASKPEDSQKQ